MKYLLLIINHSKSIMKCLLCIEMRSKLKLFSVWANEDTPNIQVSSITRHNQSNEHQNACAKADKSILHIVGHQNYHCLCQTVIK